MAVLALVALLYVQPLQSYRETRGSLLEREAEVQALQQEQERLQRRLAVQTSEVALVREARRLGYVKPGERLFVVKGVTDWRRAHAAGGTVAGDG